MRTSKELLLALLTSSALAVASTGCVGRVAPGGEGEGEGEGEVTATPGVFCAVEERVGVVRVIESFGSAFIDGRIDDGVAFGPPTISEPPCAHFTPAACPTCEDGDECRFDGTCGAPVLPVVGVQVDVTTEAGTETFTADALTGRLEGSVVEAASYVLHVQIPGQPTILFASAGPAPLDNAIGEDSSEQGTDSGSVTFSWDAGDDGSMMNLFLNPNHHAPIGFSQCIVDDDEETVFASAAIIDPLRLETGFEGGTASRQFVGSVQLAIGCVELAIASETYIRPQ